MKKLGVTITKKDYQYLKSEAIKRSQDEGALVSISKIIRDIIEEHENFYLNCFDEKMSKIEKNSRVGEMNIDFSRFPLAVTIGLKHHDYLDKEVRQRSEKRGRKITKSQVVREIINEHELNINPA